MRIMDFSPAQAQTEALKYSADCKLLHRLNASLITQRDTSRSAVLSEAALADSIATSSVQRV